MNEIGPLHRGLIDHDNVQRVDLRTHNGLSCSQKEQSYHRRGDNHLRFHGQQSFPGSFFNIEKGCSR